MREYFPTRLGLEYGQRRRRYLLCQNDLHLLSFVLLARFILVKADAFLFAQHLEDPHHGGVRLALALFIFGERVGMNP